MHALHPASLLGLMGFVCLAGENVEAFPIDCRMKSELLETFEVEKCAIRELGWSDILQCGEDGLDPAGVLSLPATEHFLHGLALQILLRAAKIAGNQREIPYLRVAVDIAFTAIGQRSDDNVGLVVA